jgi:NAD(P)-dependent dehydrogenase (short-subunit alcohol dehydrogenase family)
MQLQDRVAIVTGAGQGIGYGIAEAFGREGARVVIGEVAAERGVEAAERLRAAGWQAQALPLDVTRPAACAALVEQVLAEHGRIDILVNNAGVMVLSKSEDLAEADWRLQIDVLLNGVFFMTQAVARAAMIPQRRGVVVNVASIGGMGGWPMRSAYNAAKAGVIVLTEVLATEWAQHNLRLNCVSPGVTRTDNMQVAISQGLANEAKYARRAPIGRVGEVQDIANAVLFLASDRASFVTGENLVVDGGWVPWGNLRATGFPE